MAIAFISHADCRKHDTGDGHPENARRLSAIEDRLVSAGLSDLLQHYDAVAATDRQLLRVHSREHLQALESMLPRGGHARLDPDTVISPDSLDAARRAAGAVIMAVDLVMQDKVESAFCCVRPPGHHAERERAMGFCLFNNIAAGAAHALEEHGLSRVAVIDFDVHQGNGTEQIFEHDHRVLFCSTFQHPFYPFTPLFENAANRVNVPLEAGSGSAEFRAAVSDKWLPALKTFGPQMVFVSAGFDAHRDDDMSHINLTDADYRWVSEKIAHVAARSASNRIVSTLEGGYEFASLARGVESHIRALMGLL